MSRRPPSLLHLFGIGECAFFVAEELGFHQRFGDGRAIDGYKGLFLTRALVVDGLCDKVFAGAAFALNQDGGGLAGGDLADKVHELRHLGRDTSHVVIAGAATNLAAQGLYLTAQTGGLERILDGDVKFIEVEWLAHEIVSAELKRGLNVVELWISGDHNDGAGVATPLELFQNFQAADVGQAHVEKNEVGRFVLGQFQGRLARIRLDHMVAPLFTLLAQGPAHQALVVDHQDFLSSHR